MLPVTFVDFNSYKSLRIPLTNGINYKKLARLYCEHETKWPQLAAFNFYKDLSKKEFAYIPSPLVKLTLAQVLESYNLRVVISAIPISYEKFVKKYCSTEALGINQSILFLRALNGAVDDKEMIKEGQPVAVPLFLLLQSTLTLK